MTLTEDEAQTMRAVGLSVTCLSVIGSLFIAVCYCLWEELRNWNMKLVFVLSVLDLIRDVGSVALLQVDPLPDSERVECTAVAVYTTVTGLPPVLWTACISFSLYYSVYKKKQNCTMSYQLKYYLAFVTVFSCAVTLIALAWGVYGEVPAQRVCGLRTAVARVVLLYAPLWLVIAFNVTVVCKVTRDYNRAFAPEHVLARAPPTSSRVHLLKLYPLALIVVWAWGSAMRMIELVAGESGVPHWLALLHAGFQQSQGLLNALVYGSNAYGSIISSVRACCLAVGARRHGDPALHPDHLELEQSEFSTAAVSPVFARPAVRDFRISQDSQPRQSSTGYALGSQQNSEVLGASPGEAYLGGSPLASPCSPPVSPNRRRRRRHSGARRGRDEHAGRERTHAAGGLADVIRPMDEETPHGDPANNYLAHASAADQVDPGSMLTPKPLHSVSTGASPEGHWQEEERQVLSPEGPEQLAHRPQFRPRSPSSPNGPPPAARPGQEGTPVRHTPPPQQGSPVQLSPPHSRASAQRRSGDGGAAGGTAPAGAYEDVNLDADI